VGFFIEKPSRIPRNSKLMSMFSPERETSNELKTIAFRLLKQSMLPEKYA
jgi:hypothetical protein